MPAGETTAEGGAVGGGVIGRVAGLAWRGARRAPMVTVPAAEIAVGGGLAGDHKGLKFPNRGVTVLALEDWEAALAELVDLAGPVLLPWTARRANVLVSGLRLPRAKELRAEQLELAWATAF